ncbi:MAG: polysaccharide biosynthesis/export family protein [Nitrospirae bacterium]|nr:polysaccharide biosynthesis/export family protein [Nitrospirota bacterium]MBF0540492.1 polysaccharide biosynthesis/export family protein [Nitrospirota bacterium]
MDTDKIIIKLLTFQTIKALFIIIITAFVLTNIGCSNKNTHNDDSPTISFKEGSAPEKLFSEYKVMPEDELYLFFYTDKLLKPKDFYISIGDTITVKFVHAPELNVEGQRVLPNGNISLPYVGEIMAANKNIIDLKKELVDIYSKILQNPELYVTVPQYNASRMDINIKPKNLSRLVKVRPDGYITMPLIGDLYVINKTLIEVKNDLNEAYDKLYPNLKGDVFLQNHTDSLIYVMGEVKSPNAYSVKKPITLLEALTLAGGLSRLANVKHCMVMQRHEKYISTLEVDITDLVKLDVTDLTKQKKEQTIFFLHPDDIVYVPRLKTKD